MTSTLRFAMELVPHPDPEWPGAHLEAWGTLQIVLHADGQSRMLLDWEWDLSRLAEWFAEHQAALCRAALVIAGEGPRPAESLAQALRRFGVRDFPPEDDAAADRWGDALYNYRLRHGLVLAFRGTDMPDIVIGRNRGAGEISYSNAGDEGADALEEWAYQCDLEDFCQSLRHDLRHLLATWAASTSSEATRIRAATLLTDLNQGEPTA